MKKPGLFQRLQAKKAAGKSLVGVTWYSQENWAKVKSSATDADRFEESYQAWQIMAMTALSDIQKTGINAVPYNIIADELENWCLTHNKANNAAHRAEFVAEKLQAQSELPA
jgi:hypothetical protein